MYSVGEFEKIRRLIKICFGCQQPTKRLSVWMTIRMRAIYEEYSSQYRQLAPTPWFSVITSTNAQFSVCRIVWQRKRSRNFNVWIVCFFLFSHLIGKQAQKISKLTTFVLHSTPILYKKCITYITTYASEYYHICNCCCAALLINLEGTKFTWLPLHIIDYVHEKNAETFMKYIFFFFYTRGAIVVWA